MQLFFTDCDSESKRERLWISLDNGESYTRHEINFSLDDVLFHPDRDEWLLGYDEKSETVCFIKWKLTKLIKI